MIDEVVAVLRNEGASRLRTAITGDKPLTKAELATYEDPGLYGPASVGWRVHGEMSMLIGGLRALLIQTLHPLTMAGVADHSDFREDPWGRLHRTGRFIGATTYGTTATAEHVIAMVRRIHSRVEGTAPDGRPYSATDPHLLRWVHVTEVDSFLAAYDRYGVGKLTEAERDQYVHEMAEVGRRLGATDVPTNRRELAASLDAFRPELSFGPQAREAVRFLLIPPVPLMWRGPYGIISAGAIGLLPSWARWQLRLPLLPGVESLAIKPAAAVLTRSLGWMMNGQAAREREERLMSA